MHKIIHILTSSNVAHTQTLPRHSLQRMFNFSHVLREAGKEGRRENGIKGKRIRERRKREAKESKRQNESGRKRRRQKQ